MWEFCISVDSSKQEILNFIMKKLEGEIKDCNGVLTCLNKGQCVDILIACNKFEKNRILMLIQEIISEVVCYYYKKNFLLQNLHVNITDDISKKAFICALLYFDNETDNYIVNKYLELVKKINIESFFNFRLLSLKQKWQELVEIANQNEIYFYKDDTFLELIKFLVDNIEVKNDVVNIMPLEKSYGIFDSKFDIIEPSKNMDEEKLVTDLIALSPKSINIYCSEILSSKIKTLICKLFEKRVKFVHNSINWNIKIKKFTIDFFTKLMYTTFRYNWGVIMRNIYKEELKVLLANYDDKLNEILENEGLVSLLKKSNDELRNDFALRYKTVHMQVKAKYSYKPRKELRYNLLKLRRIFALWKNTNIVLIEGGLRYSDNDKYNQFPIYNMQNPTIWPTDKTLNRIRVKALGIYVQAQGIKDLRSLRATLIRKFGLDNDTANFYVDVFRRMHSKKVLNNFSLVVDSQDIDDYHVEVFN